MLTLRTGTCPDPDPDNHKLYAPLDQWKHSATFAEEGILHRHVKEKRKVPRFFGNGHFNRSSSPQHEPQRGSEILEREWLITEHNSMSARRHFYRAK
jgi:hypothetical protein